MRCVLPREPEADRRGDRGVRAAPHGEPELRHRLQHARLLLAAARGDYAKAEDYLKRYRYLAPDQANPSRLARRALRAHRAGTTKPRRSSRRRSPIKERLLSRLRPPRDRRGRPREIPRRRPSTSARRPTKRAEPCTRGSTSASSLSIALVDAGDDEAARKERDLVPRKRPASRPGPEAERLGAHDRVPAGGVFLAAKGETAGPSALLATASCSPTRRSRTPRRRA